MPRVTFVPWGLSGETEPGGTVLDAARSVGIEISAPCAGRGTCGKCAVRVVEGDPGPGDVGSGRTLPSGPIRLACLMHPSGDVTVRPVNASYVGSACEGR